MYMCANALRCYILFCYASGIEDFCQCKLYNCRRSLCVNGVKVTAQVLCKWKPCGSLCASAEHSVRQSSARWQRATAHQPSVAREHRWMIIILIVIIILITIIVIIIVIMVVVIILINNTIIIISVMSLLIICVIGVIFHPPLPQKKKRTYVGSRHRQMRCFVDDKSSHLQMPRLFSAK